MQIPKDLCGDTEFVKRLEELVKDFTEYELVMRDEVARKNALRRDKSNQQTRDVDIKEGNVMSYQGKKVEIMALHGEVDRPVTATVSIMKNGTEMRVKVCELSEMAAAMPMYMLPATDKMGQFIMWKAEEGVVCGGIITAVDTEKNELQVHWRQQDEGVMRLSLSLALDHELQYIWILSVLQTASPRINHSIKFSTVFLRFLSNLSFVLPGGITIEWIRAPLTQQH